MKTVHTIIILIMALALQVTTCEAQKDTVHKEEFWYNGQLKSKGKYYKGIKVGVWEYYFIDGTIFQQGKYHVDLTVDTIIVIDPVSREEFTEVIKQQDPVKDDKWLEYDRDGSLLRETYYIRGIIVEDVKHF